MERRPHRHFPRRQGYGGHAKGTKGEGEVGKYDGYAPLVVEAVRMFQTGKVPVDPQETIELFAFMEAADESKRQDGKPVKNWRTLSPPRGEIL